MMRAKVLFRCRLCLAQYAGPTITIFATLAEATKDYGNPSNLRLEVLEDIHSCNPVRDIMAGTADFAGLMELEEWDAQQKTLERMLNATSEA